MYSGWLFVVSLFASQHSIFAYKIKSAPLLTERPSWLKACKRSDPELNKCVFNLLDKLLPHLAKGIPELNVDGFEPLYLDIVSLNKGSGAITINGSFINIQIAGPSNATASYTEIDLPKKSWNFGLNIPKLDIRSQYNLNGNILVLPLLGHGASELRLVDVNTKVHTDISLSLKENREIITIERMKVKFTVGRMRIRLHNLFNGNKVLGDTVNAFINQNALEIITELEESLGESLAGIFIELFNNVFTKIPTDLWLLTDEEYDKYSRDLQNQTIH